MALEFSDLEWMRLHAETLFVQDGNERLLYVNKPMNREQHRAPVLFVGRTKQGAVCRYRCDMPEDLCEEIENVVKRLKDHDLTEYKTLVSELRPIAEAHTTVGNIWAGPAYRFPDKLEKSSKCLVVDRSNANLLDYGFQDYVVELDVAQPYVVAVIDGKAVSICHTVRRSAHAVEAGVETLPEYRRRGFGLEVVKTWASLVREAGYLPLYSTSWSNTASHALAARLGLIMYGTDLHFSE